MLELVQRLKRGDDEAFKELMTRFKVPIYRYIMSMVRNEELAEELTQDTFVKVYFKIGTMRTDSLKSWIYTIAVNIVRSEMRKNRLKNIFSISDVNEVELSYSDNNDDKNLVWSLISELPEKYKIPLVMKEVHNFTFDEIAEILKKPTGTIKTLVFRGKDRMKQRYGELIK